MEELDGGVGSSFYEEANRGPERAGIVLGHMAAHAKPATPLATHRLSRQPGQIVSGEHGGAVEREALRRHHRVFIWLSPGLARCLVSILLSDLQFRLRASSCSLSGWGTHFSGQRRNWAGGKVPGAAGQSQGSAA